MNHTVKLAGYAGFQTEENETVLAAAFRQNLNLPHSCKSGFCGECKADLLSGDVEMSEYSDKALSAEDKAKGKILMCCAKPQSDVELDIPGHRPSNIPVKTLPARIETVEYEHDVAKLKLALPKAPPFLFKEGQYIELLLPNNIKRSYSIANAASDEGILELHIRRREGGVCSGMIFSENPTLKEKSIVRIRGPLGSFALNDNAKPAIFLATGTGYAPIRSMLLNMIAQNSSKSVHFYWGARHLQDLYALKEAKELCSQLPNAFFTAVLSAPNEGWEGRSGYVQNMVSQDYDNLENHEVYACGSENMIAGARETLCQERKLPQNAFFSDAFSISS